MSLHVVVLLFVGLFYYVTCGNGGGLLCVCVHGRFKMLRNHFISEKCKTVQPFKLHFLQNSPHLQLYSSTGDSKIVGSIPKSHFVKAFSALTSRSKLCQ